MKNKKKKILVTILLIILLLFALASKSFATATSVIANVIEGAIDGIVGILLLPTKFILVIVGAELGTVMGFFAENSTIGLTLEDIFFNKIPLLDINFFDFNTTNEIASTIRENIAIWYTAIRNLSAVVLAIIAIYVGIRMAISTIAEDKAKYKTMLYDWLTSLALLFVLQYIMIFTININNAFVDVLSKGLSNVSTVGDMSDYFWKQALKSVSFTSGLGCAVIYIMLQAMTFVFLISYIKRMITLAFLIVISPLVTITYSIDKMGDGKSQALNVWLKEFVYNILIQPFHCVAYLVLIQSALSVMRPSDWTESVFGVGFDSAVIAIMLIFFIFSAEDIVKHIFHFESQSMGRTIANAAIAGVVLNKVMTGTKKAASGRKSKGGSGGGSGSGSGGSGGGSGSGSGGSGGGSGSGSGGSGGGSGSGSGGSGGGSGSGSGGSGGGSGSGSGGSGGGSGKSNGKFKNAAKWAGRKVLNANAKATGALLFGGLGLGLGDPKTALAGVMSGYGMGANFAKSNQTRILKHDLARAVNKYKSENPGITEDEILNHALNLADGSQTANTDIEKELASVMQKMQEQFMANGLDERGMSKQFKRLISDINNGNISEYSRFQRYTAKIKNRFTGRRT